MANAPYGVRLLVGAAATVVEETRKLPQTILMYPMTLVSQAAHLIMRWQQNVADLVIKGDETLDAMFPSKDEQPEWATFDEDLEAPAQVSPLTSEPDRRGEGRFALYSADPPEQAKSSTETKTTKAAKSATTSKSGGTKTPATQPPDIVIELDYDELTLAQLRARLQSLNVAELDALLSYEEATKARAPFVTLLANRITRASAK
ncbi:MAG: lipid droplet-associated protein [Mycobacteriaceae bacterium]|nr:lipid droplet-associated protein [Mycobacteriaceae bacterium]